MSKRSAYRAYAREHIKAENARLPKDTLVEIPKDQWPAKAHDRNRLRVLRNRFFLVQVFQEANDIFRISVTKSQLGMGRTFADGVSWDELQHIKAMCGYADSQAIEIYPPEKDVVNVANMRHLWVLPEPLDAGWTESNK